MIYERPENERMHGLKPPDRRKAEFARNLAEIRRMEMVEGAKKMAAVFYKFLKGSFIRNNSRHDGDGDVVPDMDSGWLLDRNSIQII